MRKLNNNNNEVYCVSFGGNVTPNDFFLFKSLEKAKELYERSITKFKLRRTAWVYDERHENEFITFVAWTRDGQHDYEATIEIKTIN